MGRADKLLDAMRANPRDWQIKDVATICAQHGVECSAPRSGSHYKIKHRSMKVILTVPARRPIKPIYIRELVAYIDAVEGSEL